ncbi:hypothetical protein WICPIJ_002675 [Wickerhamomyces pijperi]|uniref:Uncharacterized protein n=1 Tax=Wickerhamomyces pijperi TaxID=599730 RepID=A0A9P8TNP5_WICPI|nr:hypothetical protein WICPIJ_002675 [Wickerhamomyces pijperi]
MKQTFFITGTTKGVPLALVKILLSQGHRVIATVHHRQPEIQAELSITNYPNLTLLHLDFTDNTTFLKLEEDLQRLGNIVIDVFISHATLNKPIESEPLLETAYTTYVKYFQVNTLGPLELLKVIKPYMVRSQFKKIILTSSALNDKNSKGQVRGNPYTIAKAGLSLIAFQLSEELKQEGFIVISYYPGLHKGCDGTDDTAMEVEEAAGAELELVDGLTLEQSGLYLDHRGNSLNR